MRAGPATHALGMARPLAVSRDRYSFCEFFAGGGMARAGLGPGWTCLFANDFDAAKAKTYAENWGADRFSCGDVGAITVSDLPHKPGMVWASFPCQDLSLAGEYRGLGTANSVRPTRSGAFWAFWRLVDGLRAQGRAPTVVVLENVVGFLSSNGGRDFAAIAEAMVATGYLFGAMIIDASHFLPHSRTRVFVIAVDGEAYVPPALTSQAPGECAPAALTSAFDGLSAAAKSRWLWWQLPEPVSAPEPLSALLEQESVCKWDSPAKTSQLVASMSATNHAKLAAIRSTGVPTIGTLFVRTRPNKAGERLVQAEVRFDGVAGCLRVPTGGASRQRILVVEGEQTRSRLLTGRETARLMGLPEDYRLPANHTKAYSLTGDGVAVPVVRYLAENLLEPLLDGQPSYR